MLIVLLKIKQPISVTTVKIKYSINTGSYCRFCFVFIIILHLQFKSNYFNSFDCSNDTDNNIRCGEVCVIITKHIIRAFSNDCRKTKTKAITPTNHNRNEPRHEPIRIPTVTRSKRGKNHAYMVRLVLVLVLPLIG